MARDVHKRAYSLAFYIMNVRSLSLAKMSRGSPVMKPASLEAR